MTRMAPFLALLAITANAASSASASTPEPPTPAGEGVVPLTLAQAVERALGGSPALARARAVGHAADAEARAARAARMPQLGLSASYTRSSDVPELTLFLPGSPPRTIFPNIPDNYRTRLSASVPIYSGGRIGALVDAAASEKEAAGLDVRASAAEVVLETTTAYWSVVTSRETEH